jgi:beta-glucosidase
MKVESKRTLLLGLSLAAGMSAARAQADADLVILPAPAAAWRTVVGTWGNQAELTSDSVIAPGPPRQRQCGRRRSTRAVAFAWKDHWATSCASKAASRWTCALPGGALVFDPRSPSWRWPARDRGLRRWCDRSVSLIEPARTWAGRAGSAWRWP